VNPSARRLALTAESIRAYSRRGNYHSDADAAADLGLPGLVAQGMHVAGAAYGTLLDAWGETFLAHGELELRFVGMVLAGDEVEARVTADEDDASIEIATVNGGRTVVVGHARRDSSVH
jgi:acyl dehydratase